MEKPMLVFSARLGIVNVVVLNSIYLHNRNTDTLFCMLRLFEIASNLHMYLFITISMKLFGFCNHNCSISAITSILLEIQFNLVFYDCICCGIVVRFLSDNKVILILQV